MLSTKSSYLYLNKFVGISVTLHKSTTRALDI